MLGDVKPRPPSIILLMTDCLSRMPQFTAMDRHALKHPLSTPHPHHPEHSLSSTVCDFIFLVFCAFACFFVLFLFV